MSIDQIARYLTSLPAVTSADNFGYRFFFYGEDQTLPFATLAESDNEFDALSDLNREGVFRVNIGISKESFQTLFPTEKAWNYSELNQFMPHPHYAAQHFICILNPDDSQLPLVLRYLEEATPSPNTASSERNDRTSPPNIKKLGVLSELGGSIKTQPQP